MGINRLNQFCELVEQGSLRAAADKIHMTPGALSKSIMQLEEDLGVQLFTRTKQRLKINVNGTNTYHIAKKILHEYENLKSTLNSQTPLLKVRRIGSYGTFTSYFLGDFLKKSSPDSQVFIKHLIPGNIEMNLLNRNIDIGISSFPVFQERVVHEEVGKVKMFIYGRKNIFNSVKFQNLPFCIPQFNIAAHGNPKHLIDGWPDHFSRNPKYYIDNLETSLEVCRQGLAVGFFPEFVIKLHNRQLKSKYQLQRLNSPKGMKNVTFPIYVATREDEDVDQFVDSLKATL